jgi:hypothetical protein
MTRFLLALLLAGVSFSIHAKDSPEPVRKVARPNIPGSFMIDFGLNGALYPPTNFEYGIWGSRTANFYYQYPIRFGRSKFSFNPGVGVSLERFKLKNNYILIDPDEPAGTDPVEKYVLVPGESFYPDIKKVMLIANYVDVPLEIRFDTKPEDIARSFNFALGARVGVLFDSQQKVKYRENDQWKKSKNKEDWGLNLLRYGAYTRIGIGAFNLFGFYNFSPLFTPDMGPENTMMNTYTFGISINGF